MKKFAIEFKWGIIFTAVSMLWMVLEKVFGLHSTHIDKHHIYTNFFIIPAITVLAFALLDKRKNFYHNKMSWLHGFIAGLVITIVIAIFNPLAQYIILEWISPEYFPNAINFTVESGKMTAEQASNYFTLINYIQQSTFGAIMMGAITSAIVAIFVRKNKR